MSLAEADEALRKQRDTRCLLGRRITDSDRDWLSRADIPNERKVAAAVKEYHVADSTVRRHLSGICGCAQ